MILIAFLSFAMIIGEDQCRMDYYFLIITIIDIFVLGIMCILTKYNETLNKRQRYWFIYSFLLLIAISLFEVTSVAVDGGPVSFRWINILVNYLGFGLTPFISIFLACALEENRSIKSAIIFEAAFLLFFGGNIPSEDDLLCGSEQSVYEGRFFRNICRSLSHRHLLFADHNFAYCLKVSE